MALIPQTQILIPNPPIGNLIVGYDNQQLNTISLIVGSNNKITSPFSNVTGNGNYITGLNGPNNISGSYNISNGINNSTIGSFNNIDGNSIIIGGDNNTAIGNFIRINGSTNSISGDSILSFNVIVDGDNNIVKSQNINISGNNNIINEGVYYSKINGNNNQLNGGLIVIDIQSYTNSNPTFSYDPTLSYSSNIFINGDNNLIATYSTFVYINGNGNNVGESYSNVYSFGDNETPLSNQFTIANNLDVNIKGAVLPCNLIQDYTPNGQNDQTGVDGWVTKDVDNVYVKTSVGWRILPFNNTYGSFYDTSTQSSLTASTPLAMTFDSTQVAKDVSIQNGSQITVDWDGVYNIQFSAVFEKSTSNAADIDIWFRYNGTDIPYSNTKLTIAGSSKTVESWNYVYSMTASSYIEIIWASDSNKVELVSIPAQQQPTIPETPSVILTVDKISSL